MDATNFMKIVVTPPGYIMVASSKTDKLDAVGLYMRYYQNDENTLTRLQTFTRTCLVDEACALSSLLRGFI